MSENLTVRTTDPVQARLLQLEGELALQKKYRVESAVENLVHNFQVTREEAPRAIARAMADETYIDELRGRPQMLPGNAPLNLGLSIIGDDARNTLQAMQRQILTAPQLAALGDRFPFATAEHANTIGAIWRRERERLLPVLNETANNIDAALKRNVIMQETVRAFAVRLKVLRAFATVFQNVPLQGTDKIEVPYYPLQATASTDWNADNGYVFGQATNTEKREITVDKRKYQPLDYSSQTFRRQPWFDAVKLGNINAEKLGVDVFTDIWSVITAANYGAAVKTSTAASMTSDDIVDVKGACDEANWPLEGRSLIVNDAVDGALQKDSAYKLALNIGTTSVIQQGKLPRLSGFDYSWVPNMPTNAENLIGVAAFISGLLAAFCPVEPTPEVRAQLFAYEIATDPETGISMNYRAWGLAQSDRTYQIIESAYGYAKGVAAGIKRICSP